MQNLKVVVGEHNLNILGDGEQTFSVVKITAHPQFNKTLGFDYDFAVLQISPSVIIPLTNAKVGIVCLPPNVTETFANYKLTASGWGTSYYWDKFWNSSSIYGSGDFRMCWAL